MVVAMMLMNTAAYTMEPDHDNGVSPVVADEARSELVVDDRDTIIASLTSQNEQLLRNQAAMQDKIGLLEQQLRTKDQLIRTKDQLTTNLRAQVGNLLWQIEMQIQIAIGCGRPA
jgi:hypothetical protein